MDIDPGCAWWAIADKGVASSRVTKYHSSSGFNAIAELNNESTLTPKVTDENSSRGKTGR